MRRSSSGRRDSSGPVCFTNKQMGDYLSNLRSNPVSRPAGARASEYSISRRSLANDEYSSIHPDPSAYENGLSHSRSSSALSHHYQDSTGRSSSERMYWPSKANWNQRHQEMEEARMMRDVLATHDLEDDERIRGNAKKEAQMLMWQHQNPHTPYRVSDQATVSNRSNQMYGNGAYSQPESHIRAQRKPRKSSSSFSLSRLSLHGRNSRRRDTNSNSYEPFPNDKERIFEDNSSVHRHHYQQGQYFQSVSSRMPLADDPTSNSNIYPQDTRSMANGLSYDKLGAVKDNHTYAHHYQHEGDHGEYMPSEDQNEEWEDETRYRNGIEIRSDDIRAATSMKRKDRSPNLPFPQVVSDRPGRPIVSFDSDWQPKEERDTGFSQYQESYPQPPPVAQAVLENRPYEQGSAPNSNVPDIYDYNSSHVQSDGVGRYPIPTISEPDPSFSDEDSVLNHASVPTIQIAEDSYNVSDEHRMSIPSISVQEPSPQKDARAEPAASRPSPRNAPSAPVGSASNPIWRGRKRESNTSVLCVQCALPISGRTVTAAGARFHPGCFTCHQCHQSLECVGFHPEPATYREERIDRIERRMDGEHVEPPEGVPIEDDDDDSLRFYCQLDFHELFSPRCKTCKTPIEGEYIEACGGFYHASPNHFFCAQCGDPFDDHTPYIEAQSYAWCVRCHTNRFSTKCLKCKNPITDASIEALGGEYHEDCFVCAECGGELAGGRFVEREDSNGPVCLECGGHMHMMGFRDAWKERQTGEVKV